MSELIAFKPSLRVRKSAPALVMRGMFINTILETGYMGVTLEYDSKCEHTLDDMMYLKEDSDGTKLKERGKDPATGVTYEKYGHTSDADDYFICAAFESEYLAYQRGGRAVSVTIGSNRSKNSW